MLYLFSVEQIESYVAIAQNADIADLDELSAQHITSCTPNELQCGGSGGCQGSIPQLGFVYTQLFGLQKEADYPYTSGSGVSKNSIRPRRATDLFSIKTLQMYLHSLPKVGLHIFVWFSKNT